MKKWNIIPYFCQSEDRYNSQINYTKEEISIYQLNKMVDGNYDFYYRDDRKSLSSKK